MIAVNSKAFPFFHSSVPGTTQSVPLAMSWNDSILAFCAEKRSVADTHGAFESNYYDVLAGFGMALEHSSTL